MSSKLYVLKNSKGYSLRNKWGSHTFKTTTYMSDAAIFQFDENDDTPLLFQKKFDAYHDEDSEFVEVKFMEATHLNSLFEDLRDIKSKLSRQQYENDQLKANVAMSKSNLI